MAQSILNIDGEFTRKAEAMAKRHGATPTSIGAQVHVEQGSASTRGTVIAQTDRGANYRWVQVPAESWLALAEQGADIQSGCVLMEITKHGAYLRKFTFDDVAEVVARVTADLDRLTNPNTTTAAPTEQDTKTKEQDMNTEHTPRKAANLNAYTDAERAADLAKAEAIHAASKAAKQQTEQDTTPTAAPTQTKEQDMSTEQAQPKRIERDGFTFTDRGDFADSYDVSNAEWPALGRVAKHEPSRSRVEWMAWDAEGNPKSSWKSRKRAAVHLQACAEVAKHEQEKAVEVEAVEAKPEQAKPVDLTKTITRENTRKHAQSIRILSRLAADLSTEGHTMTAAESVDYPSMIAVACECGWRPSVAGGARGLDRSLHKHATQVAEAAQPEQDTAPTAVPTEKEQDMNAQQDTTQAQPSSKGKALAEQMRAAGIKITPESWAAAKAGTLDWSAAAEARGDRMTKADRKAMNKMLAEALKAQGFKATGADWEQAKSGTLAGFKAPVAA